MDPLCAFQFFDVMRRLSCFLVGDGKAREWDTNWVQHRREQGSETPLDDARAPFNLSHVQLPGPHAGCVLSVGGRKAVYL